MRARTPRGRARASAHAAPKGERSGRPGTEQDRPMGAEIACWRKVYITFTLSFTPFPSSSVHGGNRPTVYRRTQLSCALLHNFPLPQRNPFFLIFRINFVRFDFSQDRLKNFGRGGIFCSAKFSSEVCIWWRTKLVVFKNDFCWML